MRNLGCSQVGILKPRYHIYGSALRAAQILESKSQPHKVRVDQEILDLVENNANIMRSQTDPNDPFLLDLTTRR